MQSHKRDELIPQMGLRLPSHATPTWLIAQGIARQTAYRLRQSPTRIDLAVLANLCAILQCTPNDLLTSKQIK